MNHVANEQKSIEAVTCEADLEWLMIDSTVVRAHQYAAGAPIGGGLLLAVSGPATGAAFVAPEGPRCSRRTLSCGSVATAWLLRSFRKAEVGPGVYTALAMVIAESWTRRSTASASRRAAERAL